MSEPDVTNLLERALSGDREALGELLEMHRGYLRVIAQRWLQGDVAVRVGASDVVQKTFLSAFAKFEQFDGRSAGEFAAWLRVVHDRNLRDAVRDHVHAEKRAVDVEVPFDRGPAGEAAWSVVTPSQMALENERAVHLARALERLPEEQREVLRLRYFEGWKLGEIADHLDKTRPAVSGLLARGTHTLRTLLSD